MCLYLLYHGHFNKIALKWFYEKLLLHLTHCFSFIMQQKMTPTGKRRTPEDNVC